MSTFIRTDVLSPNNVENDQRLMHADYIATYYVTVGDAVNDYLWPRSRLVGCDYSSVGPIWDLVWYEWFFQPGQPIASGGAGAYTITGVARDTNGAGLASATVKCYLTATDEIVSSVATGADGAYWIGTPYAGTHYLVVYKAGSPDVAGTTINTLTGT